MSTKALYDEMLADSPWGFWPLDEGGAGNFLDRSGNSRDWLATGTLGRNDIQLVRADARKILSFTSGGNLDDNSWSPWTTDSDRTFEFWLKRNTNTGVDAIIAGAATPTPYLRCDSGSNDVSWFSDTSAAAVTWTNALSVGLTHQLVLTYRDSTKVSELFVDALSQGTKTSANKYPTRFTTQLGIEASNSSTSFDGWMGFVAIFPSILSEQRIRAHRRAGLGISRRARTARLRAA